MLLLYLIISDKDLGMVLHLVIITTTPLVTITIMEATTTGITISSNKVVGEEAIIVATVFMDQETEK